MCFFLNQSFFWHSLNQGKLNANAQILRVEIVVDAQESFIFTLLSGPKEWARFWLCGIILYRM